MTDDRRRCTHCQTLVAADALFCPACREPMATSLFSLDAIAPPTKTPPGPAAVDRRTTHDAGAPPSSSSSSGLELALPTRCRVCGGTLGDEAMQRRGTCVLHAHLSAADARPMTTTTPAPPARDDGDDDGERPPNTSPVGALASVVVVVALGLGAWWWLAHDDAGDVVVDGAGATAATAAATTQGGDRVDEQLGRGAAAQIADASVHPPSSPAALAARSDDDAVSAEVEQLIAQSGHPMAPDLGEYEAVLDGTADNAPGPTARGWAAVGQLDDDDARATAQRKLDALAAAHPADVTVAIARAEAHVADDPDGALVAAAKTTDVADAARLRGRAFAQQGDVDGAVAALAATADRDPRATRALVAVQAPRGRCADVVAASAKLAAARGGQAVVDHVRLLGACRPTLDEARALVDAVVHLPATTGAERAALQGALAEAALSRDVDDVADRACADVDAATTPSPDVARARLRCSLVRAGASTITLPGALASPPPSSTSSTALLRQFGIHDAQTAPWGRAGAQLRLVGALHDGAAVPATLVEVVEALWSPPASTARVPPLGTRERDALIASLVPAARRGVASALARGLAGDVDGALTALGGAHDVDADAARAVLLVAAGRFDEARKASPTKLASTVVGRAVTALSTSSTSSTTSALRALLGDPHVGPRVYRALVERGAATPADAALARRFALHPDVIAGNGR